MTLTVFAVQSAVKIAYSVFVRTAGNGVDESRGTEPKVGVRKTKTIHWKMVKCWVELSGNCRVGDQSSVGLSLRLTAFKLEPFFHTSILISAALKTFMATSCVPVALSVVSQSVRIGEVKGS